jgi:ankyrin repeat protein
VNIKGLDAWTALHFAANEGRTEVVKELLSISDIENEPESSIMRTPLHLAAIRGHTSIVRLLIAHGADKNAKDFDENSPLHHASEFGQVECIICLVKELGADPASKNKFGYTPSDIAHNIQIR